MDNIRERNLIIGRSCEEIEEEEGVRLQFSIFSDVRYYCRYFSDI